VAEPELGQHVDEGDHPDDPPDDPPAGHLDSCLRQDTPSLPSCHEDLLAGGGAACHAACPLAYGALEGQPRQGGDEGGKPEEEDLPVFAPQAPQPLFLGQGPEYLGIVAVAA